MLFKITVLLLAVMIFGWDDTSIVESLDADL